MLRSLLSKLAIAVLIFLVLGFLTFMALPQIVNALLLESFLQRLPISDPHAALSDITLSSTSGSIELEDKAKPLVSIPKFTLSYSLNSLLDGQTESLTIEHAVFHLYRDGGAWVLPAIQKKPTGSLSESTNLRTTLPIGIDAIQLHDCRIILHNPGDSVITIGISGEIKTTITSRNQEKILESISGSVALSDDVTAAVNLSLVFDQHQIKAQIGVKDAQVLVAKRFLPSPLQGFEFGVLNATLGLDADERSLDALHYRLSGSLQDVAYVHDRTALYAAVNTHGVDFNISGSSDELDYKFSSLVIDAPLQAQVDISGKAQLGAQELHTSGTLKTLLRFADQADSSQLPAVLSYSGAWTKSAGLKLETEGHLRPEQTLILPEAFIGSPASIELAELSITSRLHLHQDQLQSRLKITSSPFQFRHRNGSLEGSDVQLQAAVKAVKGQLSVRIDGRAGNLKLPEQKLSVDGLLFSVPIALVAASASVPDAQDGNLAIKSISFNGEPVASLSTDIRLKGSTYRADGSLTSPAAPNGRLQFRATASALPASAALAWKLAPVTISSKGLAPFGVAPHDLVFEALLDASGEIELAGSGLSGWTTASMHDGALHSDEKGITLEGIDCAIEFPELPRLLSRPGQRCSVSRADISSLHFSDAEFIFRLEDPPALFIEKSIVNWCGGTLDSGSLRLAMDTAEIDTVLYGSRINLGQLLEQFGFKISEGEGSLNGKLPVRISRETVEFDGGFLFSTPGTGGIVRFTDTDLLRQGIGGVSEAGSVNYALRALEDFSYNWTKLTFDTTSDGLLMTLELDGKPLTALPFKLNRDGMIVRSEKGAGLQYPIRLDVNVRLPLAELFKVGRSFNSIMENNR